MKQIAETCYVHEVGCSSYFAPVNKPWPSMCNFLEYQLRIGLCGRKSLYKTKHRHCSRRIPTVAFTGTFGRCSFCSHILSTASILLSLRFPAFHRLLNFREKTIQTFFNSWTRTYNKKLRLLWIFPNNSVRASSCGHYKHRSVTPHQRVPHIILYIYI